MAMIPILIDHDPERQIGSVEYVGDKLVCRLTQPLTRSQVFELFGNGLGLLVLERTYPANSEPLIHAIELLEWSLLQ